MVSIIFNNVWCLSLIIALSVIGRVAGAGAAQCVNLRDFTGFFENIQINPFAQMTKLIFNKQFEPFLEIIDECAKTNDVMVLAMTSYRNRAEQDRLRRAGFMPSTTSNHLAGFAIDFNLGFPSGARCGSDCLQRQSGSAGAFIKCARNAGLRWGGTFSVRDPVHLDSRYTESVDSKWYQAVVNIVAADYEMCFENDESYRDQVVPLEGNGAALAGGKDARLPLQICAKVKHEGTSDVVYEPLDDQPRSTVISGGPGSFAASRAEPVVPLSYPGKRDGLTGNYTVVRLTNPLHSLQDTLSFVNLDDFTHCVDAVPDGLAVCQGPPALFDQAAGGNLRSSLLGPVGGGGLPLYATPLIGMSPALRVPWGSVLRVVASRTDVRGPAYSSAKPYYAPWLDHSADSHLDWVAVRLVAVPPSAEDSVPESAPGSVYFVQLGNIHACLDDELEAASVPVVPPCPSLVEEPAAWLREPQLAQCKIDEAVWAGAQCTGFGQTGVCVASPADCPTTAFALTSESAQSPVRGCAGLPNAGYCCLPNTECRHQASSKDRQLGVCADAGQCVNERFGAAYSSSSSTSGCGPFPGSIRCCILKKPNPCTHRDGTAGVCIPQDVCTDSLGGATESGRCNAPGDARRSDVKCCAGTVVPTLSFGQGYDIADADWGGYFGGQLDAAEDLESGSSAFTMLIGGLGAAGALVCCMVLLGAVVLFRRSRARAGDSSSEAFRTASTRRRGSSGVSRAHGERSRRGTVSRATGGHGRLPMYHPQSSRPGSVKGSRRTSLKFASPHNTALSGTHSFNNRFV